MRNNFVNNSSDELDWLMTSKKAGAYSHAHKKQCAAEDRYFRAMHEIDAAEAALKPLVGSQARVPTLLQAIAREYEVLQALAEDAEAVKRVAEAQVGLRKLLGVDENGDCVATSSAASSKGGNVAIVMNPALKKAIEGIAIATKAGNAARFAKAIVAGDLALETKEQQRGLAAARKVQDEALAEMERWSKREVETVDYAAAMVREEEAWLQREKEANEAALRTMRRYIPVEVGRMSVSDIMQAARAQGGLLPLELAVEIKANRLLHWLVTHPADVACAYFLAGEMKQYFENLEGLDILELRALAVCLPVRFELDGDGKKAQWRARLMARVRQLVAQANRDTVKGTWDPVAKKRAEVRTD
jgi:hypothetical protein